MIGSNQKLLMARAGVPISSPSGGLAFVGGARSNQTSTQTPTFSLTSLSGGSNSSPSAGDIVIACVGFNDGANRDIACTTSGYTEIVDAYIDATNDINLGIFYKVLSEADTNVSFDLGVAPVTAGFACHVWRGQDATPLDATTTVLTTTGTRPNPPPITTITPNAVVIAVGSSTGGASFLGASLATPTAPEGMENFFQYTSSSFVAIAIASAMVADEGTYDPAPFGGFSTNFRNSQCSATIALRPA